MSHALVVLDKRGRKKPADEACGEVGWRRTTVTKRERGGNPGRTAVASLVAEVTLNVAHTTVGSAAFGIAHGPAH